MLSVTIFFLREEATLREIIELLSKDIELLKKENENLGKVVTSLNSILSHNTTHKTQETNTFTDPWRWESASLKKSNRSQFSKINFPPLRTNNRFSPLLDQSLDLDDDSENRQVVSSCIEELKSNSSLCEPRPTEKSECSLSLRKTKPLKVHLYADSQGRSVRLKV